MQVTTIGLDLAKRVFQVHGVDASGRAIVRRKASRPGFPASFHVRAVLRAAEEGPIGPDDHRVDENLMAGQRVKPIQDLPPDGPVGVFECCSTTQPARIRA